MSSLPLAHNRLTGSWSWTRLHSTRLPHLALTVALATLMPSSLDRWQWAAVLTIVIVVGLPHGALDPVLAHRVGLLTSPARGFALLLAYVGLVTSALALWWAATSVALIAFFALTGWHFSRDWARRGFPLVGWSAVLMLLGLPALSHPLEVSALFDALGITQAAEVTTALAGVGLLAVGLAAVAVAMRRVTWPGVVELIGLAAGGLLLSPVWFFVLYFCTLHSVDHVTDRLPITLSTHRGRLLAVVAACTVPVVLVGAGYVVTAPPSPMDDRFATVLFAGLFALTVPHLMLVEWADSRSLVQRKETSHVV